MISTYRLLRYLDREYIPMFPFEIFICVIPDCRLYESENEKNMTEQRHRMKVECGNFWVAIHSIISSDSEITELVMGLADGTVVAVTRSVDGVFQTFTRSATGRRIVQDRFTWPDGRTMLEYYETDPIAVVVAANGTRIIANFGHLSDFVCEVYMLDGSHFQTRIDPAVKYCPCKPVQKLIDNSHPFSVDDEDDEDYDDDKYLVCRRDLSGYEFVNRVESLVLKTVVSTTDVSSLSDSEGVEKDTETEREETSTDVLMPVTILRTLTRSPFDDGTASLVNKMLFDHFETVKSVADRLNAECHIDDVKTKSGNVTTKQSGSPTNSLYYDDEQGTADEKVTSDSEIQQ